MRDLWLALSVQWDDCSVALGDRQRVHRIRRAGAVAAPGAGSVASRDALLLVDAVLTEAGIRGDALAGLVVSRGPGAFTALRVGTALVQGLARAWRLPVLAPDALAAMTAGGARMAQTPSWLQFSALDARMGEVYFALHRCQAGQAPVACLAPAVAPAGQAVARVSEWLAGGHAEGLAERLICSGQVFTQSPVLQAFAGQPGRMLDAGYRGEPDAADLLAVALAPGGPAPIDPVLLRPLYVRDKVALDRDEQARARGAAGAAR